MKNLPWRLGHRRHGPRGGVFAAKFPTPCGGGTEAEDYTSFLAPAVILSPTPSKMKKIAMPHHRVYTT